jgi:NADH:ubiquinone oxidoreductase subunit 5 (subunit L)/multisubunit Na+/H+ antiporter MnhA subunit
MPNADTIIMIFTICSISLFVFAVLRSLYRRGKKHGEKKLKTKEDKKKEHELATNILKAVIVLGMLAYFFGGGLEKQANKNLQTIKNQVADDAVAQYGIAQRNGTAVDRCVQASFVLAAYLQAQDESNYKQWQAIEKNECQNAGVPR